MLEKLPELVNEDAALVRRGRHMSNRFLIEIGADQYLVTVEKGRIGIRQMGGHKILMRDFKVERL